MKSATQQASSLVELLSQRLFPAKRTVLAKAEVLRSAKRKEAVAYIEECEAYEAELSLLSETTLRALLEDEIERDKEIESAKAEREENNRFFYDRSARADYTNWIHRETWTVDEATALLLGKDPEVVDWRSINPLVYKSHFAQRYAELRQQIKEAKASGEIHPSNRPAAFLQFAKSVGFVLPADFQILLVPREELRNSNDQSSDKVGDALGEGVSAFQQLIEQNRRKLNQTGAESKGLSGEQTIALMRQEREVLLRILGAIAVGCYALEPKSDDMSATQMIVADLQKGGFSLSLSTAHKLFGDAARLAASRSNQPHETTSVHTHNQ